ncbi:MAG: hypothetical protein EA342_11535 [Leptolyngbya sp. LCM1.Bin17]|nr:MAG: hypothetical protein EA342_11535 [Leptolyngbya sp. LCM1.Bin17]
MAGKSVIKYKYAKNAQGEIVFIEDLENTPSIRKEEFRCISCKNILIPKLGKIRQKHFSHKHFFDCSGETYLHRLAKELFAQEYRICLNQRKPFEIELAIPEYCKKYQKRFGQQCNLEIARKLFDLTKRYKKIDLEKKDGDFIPDITLANEEETDKLYIEIAVTHEISDSKMRSGSKIIEINIETETDIFFARDHVIRAGNKIKFFNLKVNSREGECEGRENCPNEVKLFRVYKSGKSICLSESFPSAAYVLDVRKDQIIYHEVIHPNDWHGSDSFIAKIVEVRAKGIAVRNCYLCRYYADNRFFDEENNPIFCKFLKIRCNSNKAAECDFFRL